jgi:hypothetical protein
LSTSRSRPRPRNSRSPRIAHGGKTSVARYPHATALQITADCGGGNGNRTRLWKLELQQLADQTGLQIRVCHFPSGTSK